MVNTIGDFKNHYLIGSYGTQAFPDTMGDRDKSIVSKRMW
jgi:hypothetical protein